MVAATDFARIDVTVQVNGKNGPTVSVLKTDDLGHIAAEVMGDPAVVALVADRPVKRIVHAAGGRLVNIVTA